MLQKYDIGVIVITLIYAFMTFIMGKTYTVEHFLVVAALYTVVAIVINKIEGLW